MLLPNWIFIWKASKKWVRLVHQSKESSLFRHYEPAKISLKNTIPLQHILGQAWAFISRFVSVWKQRTISISVLDFLQIHSIIIIIISSELAHLSPRNATHISWNQARWPTHVHSILFQNTILKWRKEINDSRHLEGDWGKKRAIKECKKWRRVSQLQSLS